MGFNHCFEPFSSKLKALREPEINNKLQNLCWVWAALSPKELCSTKHRHTQLEEMLWTTFYLLCIFKMYIFQGVHWSVGFSDKTFSIPEWCFVVRESRPCKTSALMWFNLVLQKTKAKDCCCITLVSAYFWNKCRDVNRSALKLL